MKPSELIVLLTKQSNIVSVIITAQRSHHAFSTMLFFSFAANTLGVGGWQFLLRRSHHLPYLFSFGIIKLRFITFLFIRLVCDRTLQVIIAFGTHYVLPEPLRNTMNLFYKLINRWNQYTVKPRTLIPYQFRICNLSDIGLTEFAFALFVEGKKNLCLAK